MVGLLPGSGSDPDHLWRPVPMLDEHRTAIGVVSVVSFVAAEMALARARLNGDLPAPRLGQLTVLTFFGAWIGFAYGVATAPVVGANIGGGMALLVTPVFAALALALVAGLQIRTSLASSRT